MEFLLDDAGQVREPKYRAATRHTDGSQSLGVSKGASAANRDAPLVRPRTKYEQSIMDKIPQRQKANLLQPQVYGGKVYTGMGFLPSPRTVSFVDFEVGETLRQPVQLTNVSQGFNAFKVLPPNPLFRDVLEIVYTPQSMMSAGMSCTITVVFTPKKNEDIDTELTLQAQTGFVTIPIVCRRKRASVTASCNKLDFGCIVVAEKASRSVTLTNGGALGVRMTISGDLLPLLSQVHTDADGVKRPFLNLDPEINPSKVTVINMKPFSTSTITLQFSPQQLIDVDSNLFISFDNPEVDDVVIFVKAKAIDVPVFVSNNNTMDFQCCFYGTLYRDAVTVQNTLPSAVKVVPEVPAALQGMLEYSPKFGFVQPNATFDFQVKFTPNSGIGEKLDIPLRINVSDQTMPIFFQIKAVMSRLGVTFNPSELQLGVCSFGGEMIQQSLKITNSSGVGKRMGFVKLPSNVKIRPFPVFDLNANETIEVQVCVAAPTQGQFTQTLQLVTQYDESHFIILSGHGKMKPLQFTTPMLLLPVCTVGQTCSAVTQLVNKSGQRQRFSFAISPSYGLEISPSSGTIEKGAATSIVVKFHATQENVEMILPPIPEPPVTPQAVIEEPKGKAQPKKKTKAEEEQEKKDKEKMDEDRRIEREKLMLEREKLLAEYSSLQPWEQSGPSEVWSRHRTLTIPCFVDGWSGKAIILGARCVVLRPTLVVSLPPTETTDRNTSEPATPRSTTSLSSSNPSGAIKLQYGDVPADHCCKKTVVIENLGDEASHLSVALLDPFGPFQISKPPLKVLKPKHRCEMTIDFRPTSKAVYAQNIVVHSQGSNPIFIEAIGTGLPATLTISQDKANPHAGGAEQSDIMIPMGYCLVNDKVDVPLYLTNFSPFPLHVVASFLPLMTQPFNPNGTLPFALTPRQVVVPANGKVEVIATFSPMCEGIFSTVCEIEFGGDRMKKLIKLDGVGCDRGLYVAFPHTDLPSKVSKGPFGAFGDFPVQLGSASNTPTLISLTSMEQKSVQQVISIINNKGSANGDYTIEGLLDADIKNGWKVDPVKANIAPGTKANITITFAPTQLLMDSLPIPKVSVVSICNLRLILKGGAPVSDSTIYLRVKGTACR